VEGVDSLDYFPWPQYTAVSQRPIITGLCKTTISSHYNMNLEVTCNSMHSEYNHH
jgi:hypothetical protein